MLKIPKADKVERIEDNGLVRKYILKETKYCEKCGFTTLCELTSIPDYEWWFVLSCSNCKGYNQTVYERQTMPFCEECTEHYKMDSSNVAMEIYDKVGKRICPNCAPKYLRQLRDVKQ